MKRHSPMKRGTTRLARQTPVKARNPKRRASEFARTYGSKARVAYVKAQPCVFCGRVPSAEYPNVNAHIPSRSGMSRKGHYTKIVPACPPCHTLLDEKKLPWSQEVLEVTAGIIEVRWLAHVAASLPVVPDPEQRNR